MIGSKLTIRGQTTIPKPIREYLGLEPGDRVLFVMKDDEVVLQPVKQTLLNLRGSVKPRKRPEDFEEVRMQVRERVSKRRSDG
jgi:antitoxin PrlF